MSSNKNKKRKTCSISNDDEIENNEPPTKKQRIHDTDTTNSSINDQKVNRISLIYRQF